MKKLMLLSMIYSSISSAAWVDVALGTIDKYEKKIIDTGSKLIYPIYKSGEGVAKFNYNYYIYPYTYRVERYLKIKNIEDLENRIRFDAGEGYYFLKREFQHQPIFQKIKNDFSKFKNLKFKP